MHISLLTDGLFPITIGGIQKHSTLLCHYLLKEGVKVDVYHPHSEYKEEDFFTNIEIPFSDKIRFIHIPFPSIASLPGHYFLESYLYANSIVEKSLDKIKRTNLVYAQGFTAWSYILSRKKNANLPPILVNFHGLEMYQLAFGLKQKFIYQTYKPFVKTNLLNAD